MKKEKDLLLGREARPYHGFYIEPEECPLCKYAIQPQELYCDAYIDDRQQWFITGLYLCKHCYQTFMTLQRCNLGGRTDTYKSYSTKLLYCGPTQPQGTHFSKQLEEISPEFVKIYNQAKAAEEYGLDAVCGMGYRRALEFLVKDYLVHKEPHKREKICEMSLGNCIANRITDEDIKTLASKCAWLGNDETHYIKKNEGYDVDDLKRLLNATIYWIEMKLTVEFAKTIKECK